MEVICYSKTLFLLLMFGYSLYFSAFYLSFFEFLDMQNQSSNIFEDYYVDSKGVNISFFDEKRNLIYIVVESLKMTAISTINGGTREDSFIPNLERIALSNTNFSNNDLLGGDMYSNGTNWTAGSLIGNTAGVPLKVSIDYNTYSGYSSSLLGVYSIGEVLDDNGYKNYFLLGSDADFGGRRDYFSEHGNYEILDCYWALDNKKIDEDYFVWWGYEDGKLY